MTGTIKLKTTRTRWGEANATISKFYNCSTHKVMWGFRFYQDFKAFGSEKELINYIANKYEFADGFRYYYDDKFYYNAKELMDYINNKYETKK